MQEYRILSPDPCCLESTRALDTSWRKTPSSLTFSDWCHQTNRCQKTKHMVWSPQYLGQPDRVLTKIPHIGLRLLKGKRSPRFLKVSMQVLSQRRVSPHTSIKNDKPVSSIITVLLFCWTHNCLRLPEGEEEKFMDKRCARYERQQNTASLICSNHQQHWHISSWTRKYRPNWLRKKMCVTKN